MTPELDFSIHLLVAAVGAYGMIRFLRFILVAIDIGLGGKLSDKSPWKELGTALAVALPVLPMIPAGFIFTWWPHDLILPEPAYRFLTGAVAGSIAANLYETVVRAIEARAKILLTRQSNGPDKR